MKQAIFVTNGQAVTQGYRHCWEERAPFNTREMVAPDGDGLQLFLCEFELPEGAVTARICATALGVFDLHINGQRVGKLTDAGVICDELKPEWTDYQHRVFSYQYDLRPFCHVGKNVLVASVSEGWWAGHMAGGYYTKTGKQAFCAEVEIVTPEGSTIYATGTAAWKTAVGGPVRKADIWDGEYYDARIPHPAVQPEAYAWVETENYGDYPGQIEPFVGNPLRADAALTRAPISAVVHDGVEENGSDFGKIRVIHSAQGEGCEVMLLKAGQRVILDMGQNMVGCPAITLSGATGVRVDCLFAEMLNDSGEKSRGNDGPMGSMYVENYRRAASRMTYIVAGEEREDYRPTHTYYGFRYLELSADGDVTIHAVRGMVIYSSMKPTGAMETDNPLVNQLLSNIVWGMRGNYFSNPTDCPQRDERYGWTGDTQIFCGAGAYFYDTHRFMRKWLGDIRCCQMSYGGEVGDIIPALPIVGRNSAAWADAAILVPYHMWKMFRDEALLAEHYDAMEAYMRSLEVNGLNGAKPTYGDWLCYDQTDATYIAVCYYAYDAYLMSGFSKVLARCETKYEVNNAYYHRLREKIIAHWRKTYLLEDGKLREDTQTGYLLALAFDMADGDMALIEKFRARLRKKIEENDYKLSTGFVGTGILCPTLGENGMNDLAYSLLLQTANPSWLYSVLQGATTVWERWNSYTIEDGFGPVGMNSFNHYAYGAVAEWMFGYMAGIRPDPMRGGFDHFVLAPVPDTRTPEQIPAGQTPIRHVKAHYDAPAGRIESEWDYVDGNLRYVFTVPTGTTAEVVFPVASPRDTLRINGIDRTAAELNAEIRRDAWIFRVNAGSYTVI